MTIPDPGPSRPRTDERALLLLRQKQVSRRLWRAITALAALVLTVSSAYGIWGPKASPSEVPAMLTSANASGLDYSVLAAQANPREGYSLPARYGDLGPRLLGAGVIDYDAFAAIYESSGNPLSPGEIEILKQGSDDQIVIGPANAHFLLNLFWAVGLANRNTILTDGPMVTHSNGQIEGFASTGGWSLATRPVSELYASLDLIPLTPAQQALVEEVAAAVYRPCCDNSTLFPDCNHGMAMLGLLELMASQGASVDEMFDAAKYINAFWFPQQTLETAIYLKVSQDVDFVDADPRLLVGRELSSMTGAGAVHQALAGSGLLQQAPGQQNGCSN